MLKSATITSAANPLLKDVRRAIARGGLTSNGWCVAESPHLLEEALRSRCEVAAVLAAESAILPALRGIKVTILPDRLLQSLSSTEASQGVIALVQPPVWTARDLFGSRALVVVLDGVQDPGNAGAIVRAAEAFGATGAVFLKGAAGPFHPKTLRASAGSLFRLPFLHGEGPEALIDMGVELFATVPARHDSRPIHDVDFTRACAIVIGSEAHGVGDLLSLATPVSIPTSGVESLNAAVAAGVVLYEAARQRARKP